MELVRGKLLFVRDIIVLGSTGSIGRQTLDVVRSRRDQYRICGLSARGGDVELLADQIAEFAPSFVAIADPTAAPKLREALIAKGIAGDQQPRLLIGDQAARELANYRCDICVNAITGAAGLEPTLTALATGSTLALANKESLVIGGSLVTRAAAPGQLVAIDSEHSALAQALRAGRKSEVRKLVLTASGGPFRGMTREQLATVTPEQAMSHPTWAMGRVITINSSTMVNKGLELIEAGLLFDMNLHDIEVVVHPQSVVHSMVEFCDGSTIAQASPPDMRLPIGLALGWPERLPNLGAPCDWTKPHSWTFEPLDASVFPAVELARRAGLVGGTAPAVYNAANEVCVDAFCAGALDFLAITSTIESVLREHLLGDVILDGELKLENVLSADRWARARAAELTS